MNFFIYLFQVNLFLALFIAFYWLVLRKETFFAHNRIYLNISALLSFIIPFIQSEWFQNLIITEQVRQVAYAVPVTVIYEPVPIGDINKVPVFNWAFGIAAIYLIGVLFFLGRFALQLMSLKKELAAPQSGAFSFFGQMFIAENIPGKATIANHEQVHARQWHSLDVIFIELITILNWFNPLAHAYRKEIKHVHEFIADEEACGQDKENYALLLLSQTLGVTPHQLTNSFFNQSLLKRRITMLGKTRSNRIGLLKYGLCTPLFGAMLIFSSATVSKQANLAKDHLEAETNYAALNETGYDLSDSINKLSIKNGKQSPLYILNDREVEKNTIDKLNPEMIASVNVIKNSEAIEKYGNKAANGVIIVSTEKTKSKIAIEGPSGNNPIYVVDGVKMDKGISGKSLDPNTISSVNILKDNSAVSKYGKNGTHGAIEITTKKATSKVSKPDSNLKMSKVVVSGSKTDAAMEPVGGYQDDKVVDFASVDELPKFPGGDQGFGNFLSNNIQYPAAAKVNNITGRVIVTFIVAKDGSLEDIKVLRGLGYGTDKEAVRVLNLSPKWSPGKQKGKPVKVQYTIPIFFQLPKKAE